MKTPKLHFVDSGLLAAVRGLSIDRIRSDYKFFGALLETCAVSELLKQAGWGDDDIDLFHYRDKDKVEVDVVLENGAGETVGVEIKSAATVTARDFRGLARLKSACGKTFKAGVVLYDGEHILPFGERLYAAPFSCLWS